MHKNNAARDIYHDLMPFRVKEILLVATLYDAYAIEREGRFTEQIMGGYHHLHLTSMPRVTGVTTYEEAYEQLSEKHYDLIIVMVGGDKKSPVELSCLVKKDFPYIPIFMLLNNDMDIPYFEIRKDEMGVLDEIFVWHGDPKVFSAMVTHLEDKVNVENDTQIGLARVILLVEDSVKYYSKYLPLLYSSVLEQTNRIIEDVSTDELYVNLRLRARPKVLLVRSYEEAIEIFKKYKDYLLCLISDVEFYRNGKLDENSGFDLVNYAKKKISDLPVILQSAKIEYSQDAYELKTVFINKNSKSLLQDIKTFISHYLGFGNFVYKDAYGKAIAISRNLKEFEHNLRTVPIESIVYHAKKNHFSLWLMARGEIKIAKMIAPYRITDFESMEQIREYLCKVIKQHREEQNQGKVIDFDEIETVEACNVVSLSGGSLGGKGRGLAFINTLLYNFDFEAHVPGIVIKTPRTTVIGTDEFEFFLERNNFQDLYFRDLPFMEIKELFLTGELSKTLHKKLRRLLDIFKMPIAVRSSGMLEDSLKQPFAGVFDTYLLPNNHSNREIRLKQLTDAIKLVFASVFSETARAFTEAVDFKMEEEKMAVVIQEVVGHQYDNVFYPHISGVAQSYNYYAFGHMNPEDGFAVAAFGLGKYVVDGEKAWRFSPIYPNLANSPAKDQVKNSQTEFYAVDLNKTDLDLLEGDTAGLIRQDIMEAEFHGTLNHCASVYDPDNNTITAGLDKMGPRVLNFANILKYKYIPLGKAIEVILDVVKEALGAPVEIEFAVDLKKDKRGRATFYLLQIKPLVGSLQDYEIDMAKINEQQIMLYSERGMGNGKISDVRDVIYADLSAFDKTKTMEMVNEIEQLNAIMKTEDKNYILIGPGRWGTRDKWIGIPVMWPQISNAKVIVETSLEDYPLEASGGSHFFHNVTSMHVGYCSIQHHDKVAAINWKELERQKVVNQTRYFKHVRFEQPLTIRMDGKKRKVVITCNETSNEK
ncbi:pyruvate, phosphate dikinase [Marinilabiliaceae bacterium JC017]|nr:pyruvate, phosphate dikinase [Marinilabiliaceae bacterium JC017]